jgi:peptidoglycan L-alanyl-D-glutamate endopeptidase CwlK
MALVLSSLKIEVVIMPKFGAASKRNLATCDHQIQRLLNEAIKHVDFSVTCGNRGKKAQTEAYEDGFSSVEWPDSKHNDMPSMAADVAPYANGILWDDLEGFTLLAGIIKGISLMLDIPIRIGVDWDGDLVVKEHSFLDRPHIELV